ncbi:unnamed protein product [Adineta steineri]|uniref:Transmembrane protein n=1 Tax=Adineta steineri TaxID=433720 RepID=A0A815LLR8_9BILA|nr:unnamed protein product [Adineta steineri]CAF3997410.1 unnamed protein product [Adineta steineri]
MTISFLYRVLVAESPNPPSSLWQKTRFFLQNFNLFPSIPPSTDEYQLRNQRVSTRLFIILLTVSLLILILYTSLINVTQTVNINAPTIAQYSQLYATYPQTVTCPCTKISITYDKFLHFQYTFHPVCNSVFVTNQWFDYLTASYQYTPVYTFDFRATASSTFQALNAFCEIVNQTIVNRLVQFYASDYISASVISSQIFQVQTQSLISNLRQTMNNDFTLSFSTIRKTTQSNALLTGQLTNYYLYQLSSSILTNTHPQSYGNCSCGSSATCISQSRIMDYYSGTIYLYVPGIYIGCYIIETLLQSDLQCFYNQSCIDELQPFLASSSLMNVSALDKSLLVRFVENSTVQEVMDELMIETWNSSIMYESYYNECEPSECSYTVDTKNGAIYIITTLIGLVGGLITVLKLIVPRMVKLIAPYIQLHRMGQNAVIPFG